MAYGTKPDNDILAFFKPNGVIYGAKTRAKKRENESFIPPKKNKNYWPGHSKKCYIS